MGSASFRMIPLALLLLFSANFLNGASASCEHFCATLYNVGNLRSSCSKGCTLSSGRNGDQNPVDAYCRDQCSASETSIENKAACYDGCCYIEPSLVIPSSEESAGMADLAHSLLNFPLISRLLSFMNSAANDQAGASKDDTPTIHTLRIHVVVPTDENLNPLFARPVPPELAFNEPRIVSDRPGLSQSIGRAVCRRLHNFAHHIASRPLLFVTVVFLLMNLVILLTFCCLRCRVRRMHRAAYKRQLRRMPAYFEPASVKIDMILPQPPTEKEADELPPKEPIV